MKKHRKVEARKRINLLHIQSQTVETGHGLMEVHLQLEALEKGFLTYVPAAQNQDIDKSRDQLAVS